MPKKYEYRATITIGDTNLLQNVYFTTHFRIQGMVRELWLKDCVPGAMDSLRGGLVLITKEAQCSYHREFHLWDVILVEMWFENVRNASVDLVFTFIHDVTKEIHAQGRQTIVFAGTEHSPRRIPQDFLDAIRSYAHVPNHPEQVVSLGNQAVGREDEAQRQGSSASATTRFRGPLRNK